MSDQSLTNLQFALALLTALQTGHLADRKPCRTLRERSQGIRTRLLNLERQFHRRRCEPAPYPFKQIDFKRITNVVPCQVLECVGIAI